MTAELTGSDLENAVQYNKDQNYSLEEVKEVQRTVGASGVDGYWGPDTTQAVARWQPDYDLAPDGKLGPGSFSHMVPGWYTLLDLTDEERGSVMWYTTAYESGGYANRYAAHAKDAEYAGTWHHYSHAGDNPTHIGSSIGPWQATQDAGSAGQVLSLFCSRAPVDSLEIFGPDRDEMVRVVTSQGSREAYRLSGDPARRRPSVMPIAGAELWQEPWVSRLALAAEHPEYQRAHRDVITAGYLSPSWAVAQRLDWTTHRDLAILFDISIQMGPGYFQETLWPLIAQDRPADVRSFFKHLREDHRVRREGIWEDSRWWVTYRSGEIS